MAPEEHWAHQRLLLRVRAGSQAHGLATPDSDEDSRGVCIPPKVVFFGLSDFEQWESPGGDHVIFSLKKFVRLALEANPNIIETLFTEEQDRLFTHPLAESLLSRRTLFLSKQVGVKFGRYAIHQLQKIERHHRWLVCEPPRKPKPAEFGAVSSENSPRFPDTASERAYRGAIKHHRSYQEWRKNRNPKRAELEARHGYDTKYAMHLCRLLNMGCEILESGEVLVRRPDAQWLSSVREGALSYSGLLDWVKQREADLTRAEAKSALPLEPDRKLAETLMVEITEAYLYE